MSSDESIMDPIVDINQLCDLYLRILDGRQNNVYNIRMMHHEIWKRTRPQKIIKHHRAGSRVERQIRLLPTGAKSDVDYKYEVGGVLVDIERGPENMYYKASALDIPGSEAYGYVYATETFKERLLSDDNYRKIFENSFEFDATENAFMLIPHRFKENVVNESGMDMKKDSLKRRIQSPAISGQGAMNEYDAVPCIRLRKWPLVAENWKNRKPINRQVFSSEWRSTVFSEHSLFIVPTGNPQSETETFEWRLSYSFIEKECFEQIHSAACHRIRQLYGILKYVFKKLYEKKDILNSYHLKTLFLWKVEKWPMKKWNTISVTDFVREFNNDIKSCLQRKYLDHFFIEGCNIYPYHKRTNENQLLTEITNTFKNIEDVLIEVILADLRLRRNKNYLQQAFAKLKTMNSKQFFGSYVSAYLTRLLSVCIHSVFDNLHAQNLQNCLEELRSTFNEYGHDSNIQRIVPILNSFLVRFSQHVVMSTSCSGQSTLDLMSIATIEAFGEFIVSKCVPIGKVDLYLEQYSALQDNKELIGVTVVKMEAETIENDPLQYIFRYLTEIGNQSKRIFFEPVVLLLYMKIKNIIESSFQETELQNQIFKGKTEGTGYYQHGCQHLLQKDIADHEAQQTNQREIDGPESNVMNQMKKEQLKTKQISIEDIKEKETHYRHQKGIEDQEMQHLHQNAKKEEQTQILYTNNPYKQDTLKRKSTKVQLDTQTYKKNMEELSTLFQQMTAIVAKSSDKLPYVGILSYKYTGLLLLRGYKHYLKEIFDFESSAEIDLQLESLEKLPKFSTNLDIT